MAGAGEAAYETALSAALTQTDRPTGLRYHSSLFHSSLIPPLFQQQKTPFREKNVVLEQCKMTVGRSAAGLFVGYSAGVQQFKELKGDFAT